MVLKYAETNAIGGFCTLLLRVWDACRVRNDAGRVSQRTESCHALHTGWKRPCWVRDRDYIFTKVDRSTVVILMAIAECIDPPSISFCVWCQPPRRGVNFRPLLLVRNSLLCSIEHSKTVSILFLDIDDGVSSCVMTKRARSSNIWHFAEFLACHIVTPAKQALFSWPSLAEQEASCMNVECSYQG